MAIHTPAAIKTQVQSTVIPVIVNNIRRSADTLFDQVVTTVKTADKLSPSQLAIVDARMVRRIINEARRLAREDNTASPSQIGAVLNASKLAIYFSTVPRGGVNEPSIFANAFGKPQATPAAKAFSRVRDEVVRDDAYRLKGDRNRATQINHYFQAANRHAETYWRAARGSLEANNAARAFWQHLTEDGLRAWLEKDFDTPQREARRREAEEDFDANVAEVEAVQEAPSVHTEKDILDALTLWVERAREIEIDDVRLVELYRTALDRDEDTLRELFRDVFLSEGSDLDLEDVLDD